MSTRAKNNSFFDGFRVKLPIPSYGKGHWLLIAVAGLAASGALLPILYLTLRAFGAWDDLLEQFFKTHVALLLIRTSVLILITATLSTLIGAFIAWTVTRTNVPMKNTLAVLSAFPISIPSFILAITLIELYGPRGVLQGWLEPFGVTRLPEVYGLPGAVLALTISTYPYVYLSASAALRRIDPFLEDAAKAGGMGKFGVFAFVTLPLTRSAIVAGALLVALYVLSDFGAVSLMRYETLTAGIFLQYESTFDRSAAAALSLPMIAMAFVLLVGEPVIRGRRRYSQRRAGFERKVRTVDLGGWKWPIAVICIVPVVVGLAGPVGVLVFWVWDAFLTVDLITDLLEPLWNSVYVSIMAAVAAIIPAVTIALLSVRHPGRLTSFFEKASYIGFGLPGVVVALALVFAGVNLFPFLYQSIWMLVAAYGILYLSAAIGPLRLAFTQINPRFEEAASGMGATKIELFRKVLLPLAMPAVMIGASLVFLFSMKELPATLILGPIGFKTLATSIWAAESEAFFARTGAASLLLIAMSGAPWAIFVIIRNRSPGN